jgi:REP element-mobilizing transposase RayT
MITVPTNDLDAAAAKARGAVGAPEGAMLSHIEAEASRLPPLPQKQKRGAEQMHRAPPIESISYTTALLPSLDRIFRTRHDRTMRNPLFPDRGSSALRRGRRTEPGRTYLVTFATHGRRTLFADWPLACAVARTIAKQRLWRESAVLCWVLMPDHWHGLIRSAGTEPLSATIGRVKAVSARAVHSGGHRLTRVWAPGFHDHALRREEDLRHVARYIIANPLRAGLCANIGQYPFWDAIWLE